MIINREEYLIPANIIATVVILFLCSLPNLVWGQEGNRDSLTQRFLLLDSLAEYNYHQGNDSMAIVNANNALTIIETLYGKKHQDYAHILKNIAKYKFETGEYEEAKSSILEAIEIQKEKYFNTKDYAESLSTLSDILAIEGDFSKAIEICSKSLNIITDIYGPNTIEVAIAKGNLADIHYDSSSFSKALQLCNEAISIFLLNGISNDSDYATILSIRSKAKADLGLYIEALADAKESLDVFVNLYGEQFCSNAALLSNISVIYSYLGNYSEAYKYGEKALLLYEQTYGEQHPYYVVTLKNIASYKYENGELAECIQLAERANRICNQNSDNGFPMYIFVPLKIELSKYYLEANNNDNAQLIINEVIHFLQQSNNMDTDEYASALLVLADIYSKKGIHNNAIKYAKESTQIMLNIYGKNNIRYSQFIDELSHYYSNDYHYKEAINYAMLSMKIRKEYIVSNYSDMSSLQRKNLWSRFGPSFFFYAGLAFRYHSSLLISDVYDNTCLFAKGLLLSTEISMHQLIAESNDSILTNDYNALLFLKERYNRLCERPLIVNKGTVDSIAYEIQSRELDIIRRSKSYGDYMKSMKVSWKHIQQRLGKNDIAIEFINFPVKNDSIMYVALTMRKDSDFPNMIPLFEEKQLLGVSDTIYYLCKDMYNLVWKPLQSELRGVNNIYFSPSGVLHKIGIEYLPGMEDYNLFRLSSTRELVTNGERMSNSKSAVLFGGLDYDSCIDSLTIKKNITVLNETFKEHADVKRIGLREWKEPLKHTKIEVDKIGEELNKAQWFCLLDTASLGTEESFKALSGRKINCLHIATHGFYYTKEEADKAQYKFMLLDNQTATSVEDKALSRSGLVLSGANHILEGDTIPDNVEDGILTAKEIADVDFRGLDLVVLSACQTGLGDISQGEGVFGLQRGFKKSGANSILMSLWEVDDEATQILMTQFYRNIVSGLSKRQSLHSAQKYLREYNNGRFNEPKYWAAFILLDGIDKKN